MANVFSTLRNQFIKVALYIGLGSFLIFFFPQSNIYFLKFWIANLNCLECSILIS